jgi:hypothetical protein
MNQPIRYTIRFDDLDAVAAGRAAESLGRSLQEFDQILEVKRVRTDPEALDFGSALEIALTAPAVIELAKGISNWLRRAHSSKLTVVGPDGIIIAENISARETADLAEKLARHAEL